MPSAAPPRHTPRCRGLEPGATREGADDDNMTANDRRHRRRTVGAGIGLGLLLGLGGGAITWTAVLAQPSSVQTVLVPSVSADRQVPSIAARNTRRSREAAALLDAVRERWANVPTPEDPAAAMALRARILFERSDAGDTEALDAYRPLRRRLANEIALRLGLPADALLQAWRDAPLGHQRALMAALSQLGVPYRSMASREWEGFDCSGLTLFAWSQAGVALPRSSGLQITAASPRSLEEAQAGDLVQYPGHVSMYLGVDYAIVHSPYTGRDVEVSFLTRRSVRFGDPTE